MTSSFSPRSNGVQDQAHRAGNAAASAGREAGAAGQDVAQSKSFGLLVMVGLVAYGVVHLLIAWIAVQIAWTGKGGEASQQGAMQQMAGGSVGDVLLWITAIGLFALVLWQLFTALWGYRDESGAKQARHRISSIARAVVYLALGISAVNAAVGSAKSGNTKEKSMTAKLLGLPFGQALVIAVGVGVLVVAGRLVYRGVSKKFTKDLQGGVGSGVIRLGQIGYVAKGVALAIVGVLFIVAAITFDPNKAAGLDGALRTLRNQPFGSVLLTVVALGIAAFGLYCFFWSRRAKR